MAISMKKEMAVILIAVAIMVPVFYAGCAEKGETKATPQPELTQMSGTIPTKSGWAESNWAESSDEPWKASVEIPIKFESDKVVSVELKIDVQDSDSNHSETDEGSDPDQITITITWGNASANETIKKQGSTPFSVTITLPAEPLPEGQYISGNVVVKIDGDCYGGKPTRPFPWWPIVYKDQGFAYTVSGTYTYMEVAE